MQGAMAWASPSRLQDSVARYIAKKIVRYTETCIRSAIAKVPPELLDVRATAGLLRYQYTSFDDDDNDFADDEVIGESTSHASGNRDQMNVMDIAMVMVKESLDKVQDWLSKIPKNLAGPRGSLEEAFDTYSDVHPKYDKDFPKHLTGLLIKLLVLRSVFIDRDYGDKDKLCVVPFAWESWVARLMRRIGPLYNLHELKVYGGMYPNILSAILREAPNLKSLFLSHINITDENLLVASKSCPKLEKFYLHNFPWEANSMKSLCAAFFRGTVRKELAERVMLSDDKSVQRTFTALKEVELAYGQIIDAIDFHRLLLKYYPEIVSFSCDWKTCVFDKQCETHGREVLKPITQNGKKLSLSKVFLTSGSVYSMDLNELHKFGRCCPDVKTLVLDITNLGGSTSNAWQSEGKNMLYLILEWPKLDELHLNLNFFVNRSKDFLLPILMTKGPSLTSLTLEASVVYQDLNSNTVFWFLEHCPNLVHLRVRLWKRSMLLVPNNEEGLKFPECKLLKELSFHEDGPGDDDDSPQAEDGHRRRWSAVLEELLTASPNLHTLSISLCHGLSSVLKSVESNIEVLHLHMKSCYEWNPSIEMIQDLVSHLPNLQYLYLEDLSGTTYWKIWQHYRNTGLKLHWGNLHGWPRT